MVIEVIVVRCMKVAGKGGASLITLPVVDASRLTSVVALDRSIRYSSITTLFVSVFRFYRTVYPNNQYATYPHSKEE